MELLEKILAKANELGHLLNQHEIVQRHKELSEALRASGESQKLLEEYMRLSEEYHQKEYTGGTIEVSEKKKLAEFEDKIQKDAILGDLLAAQAYYLQLLKQVNDVIANPTGEPPSESKIITPGSASGIILP